MNDQQIEKAIDGVVDGCCGCKKKKKKVTEAFMQPEIIQGMWYEIDGPSGLEFYPVDELGAIPEIEAEFEANGSVLGNAMEWENKEMPAGLRDYVESDEVWTITKREGFGGRLQAPGYLDSTPWSVYDSEEEAEAELKDMYGDDEGEF